MYPHRIRLRTPWEAETAEPHAGPARVKVPARLCDTGWQGFAGAMRLIRKFGYPGRIDVFERVWLTVADLVGAADIILNNQPVATKCSGTFEFDVTALLTPRNRLEVLLQADSDQCGLTGEVALEIRCAAYLHAVTTKLSPEGDLQVRGQLLGAWPEPLDLYVLIDGRNVHYQALHANGAGQEFVAVIPAAEAKGQTVRVELVQGAVVWYRVDEIVSSP